MSESHIKITAETEEAESKLATLGEHVKMLDEHFLGLGEAMGALGAAAVAGGLTELMASSLETADQMGKMAQKAGVGVESLSRLSVAARLSDVDTQSLAAAMGKLDKNMIAAQDGTGQQAQAFRQLGISVTDANGTLKSSDEVMSEVANKFHDTADGAGKTAAAMAIFGKTGAELIPMLNGGSEELDKFGKLADQLGLTLNDSTANAAQDVNDRFQIMRMAVEGVGMTVMKDMLPTFTSMSEVMVDTATNTEMLHGAADTLSFALKGIVSIGMGAVFAFHEVGQAMGGLAAAGAALAHGDLSAVGSILGDVKATFDKDAESMSATMDKLWADHSAQQKKAEEQKGALDFNPGNGGKDQKILDAAQKQDDALLAMHEDSFSKTIEKWKETEDKLISLGAAGTAQREIHEQAYTAFVLAETDKRNQAAASSRDALLKSENDYFAKQQVAVDDFHKTAKDREDKRFQNEMIVYQDHLTRAQANHTVEGAELEAFETAKDNIIKAHQERRMRDENSVANFSQLLRAGDYQDAMTMAQAMTAGLAQHSRAAFEVNKAASLASATVKGYHAVINAYEDGTMWGGPIGGAIEAAMAVAFVGAQIDQINSTQFGGGGKAPSASGAAAGVPSLANSPGAPVNNIGNAAAPAKAAQAPTMVNLSIAGAANPNSPTFSYNQIVNELVPLLNQAGANGVVINVTGA